jgi:NAD(P)H-hydrate repair Nnr-like enzyme with NAD(P)H-hydrate epimerase domain
MGQPADYSRAVFRAGGDGGAVLKTLVDLFGNATVYCWGDHDHVKEEVYKNTGKLGWVQYRNVWLCPECAHVTDVTITAMIGAGSIKRKKKEDEQA